MNRNKKENFGHTWGDCTDDNCRMFHANVCSDSDIEEGKCSADNLAKHEKYKKNKPNQKYQHTKKNIGQSTMFKNKNTAHQETDKTVSQNAQVNQDTINLKLIKNTSLQELCKKIGM